MQTLTDFLQHNIIVIYFFYGLAFFCMGLFVWLESGRTSTFRLANAMGPLAGFGIIHGLHEWFEMFQRLRGDANIPDWLLSDNVRIIHLVLSFALLIVFGVRLVYANRSNSGRETLVAYIVAGMLVGVWIVSSVITSWVYHPATDALLTAMDVLSRYILGIPGALLAAWAIVLEQNAFRRQGLVDTGRDLLRAALALLLYGVFGQIFVAKSFLFPSTVLNSTLFLQVFGIPVQLFRAVIALVIAVFVVRAMRAFEQERQLRLVEANEARLLAQHQALVVQQQARAEMEQLNQDLLVLYDFSRRLGESLDWDAVAHTAVSRIVTAVPWVSGCQVWLQQDSQQPLSVISAAGDLVSDGEYNRDEIEQVARQVIQDGQVYSWCCGKVTAVHPGLFTNSCDNICIKGCIIGLPLSLQDNESGSFVVRVTNDVLPLKVRELNLLQTLAGQLAMAINNVTLYQKVRTRDVLRGELLHQVVSAQERERQRIARELHDGTGQTLTAIGLGFAAANTNMATDPKRAAQQLVTLKELSMKALKELRDLIANLRPSLLDDLGLVPALQSQVDEFSQRMQEMGQPMDATLVVIGKRIRLDEDIETIAYRIAQEALTNAAKHSRANKVRVTLNYNSNCLNIVVSDNGRGFDMKKITDASGDRRAWGLLGMQERVSLVGGHFTLLTSPGEGTTIDVCLPLIGEGMEYGENSLVAG